MKTNQKTIDKVSMMYQYSHDTLMPYIYFYKYLAKRDEKGVKLWIPDSIVFNDLDLPPMWFYSS